jgi:hypothetical protein
MLFTGRKCVTLEKFQCHVSLPYIFSRFLETFTPIIELLRLESARRHQVNTLYEKLTNLTDGFSSAFHTILQNFRQKKVEIYFSMEKLYFSSALSKSKRHLRNSIKLEENSIE